MKDFFAVYEDAQAFNPAKTKSPVSRGFLSGVVVAHQFLQDDGIWFGEAVAAEVGTCHPAPALAFEALWLEVMQRAAVVEINADFCTAHAVVVVVERHVREIEAEFFAQFTDKCSFVAFARLNLAAGKFPVTRPVFVGRAFGDEQLSVAVFDDSRDNSDGRAHQASLPWQSLTRLPEPQGQRPLRPTRASCSGVGLGMGVASSAS